jgi:hypothetical protein
MRRKQTIEDALHSVVPVGTAGSWSVGYSGHTDNTANFNAPDFKITGIRSITDKYVPGTSDLIMNDVYIDYSGSTMSGTTSIYTYI